MDNFFIIVENTVLILAVFLVTTLLHWRVNGYISPNSWILLGIGLSLFAIAGILLMIIIAPVEVLYG